MSDTAGPRNDGVVDELLLEAGLDDDGQLRDALLDLRSLAAGTPEPSAGIAALMAGAATAAPATTVLHAVAPATAALPAAKPADELAARRRAKRRITLTTLSVAASLAAGGAVAAASDQGFRDSFSQLNQAVTSFVTGSTAAPAGTKGGEVPVPGPAPTRPAAASPEAVPAAPATAPAPAGGASSSAASRPGSTPSHGSSASPAPKPAGVPAEPSLPTEVPGDVRKGLEQTPKLPVPVPTGVPLPGKATDAPLK
ncbi:hypothetical protein [Pseudarthrobacter sp. lyk4-40-TYG-27]|uniref:hypothetical protein n=1 Tax=Pseudarthrobacter sp. lyk4-40-TYG-27 TaxID=3040305 RepID=UPI00255571B2|nr:hypothetical protein [Pseudarthrobacter sp. lyk4-40-TYG-27]